MSYIMKELICLFLLCQAVILHSRSVSLNDVFQCPSKCDCKTQIEKSVSCKKQNLTEIPTSTTVMYVNVLDVSYNNFSSLGNNTFNNFSNLKSLFISHANVTWLESNTFHGLALLNKVDLSDNFIAYIEADTFKDSTNLETVILSNNLLRNLENNPILIGSSISNLDISNNKFSHLSYEVFSGMPELKTLDLSSNSLSQLSPDTFVGLTKLSTIDVSNNRWMCNDEFTQLMCWINYRRQYSDEDKKLTPTYCTVRRRNRKLWTPMICNTTDTNLPSTTNNAKSTTTPQSTTDTNLPSTTNNAESTMTPQSTIALYSTFTEMQDAKLFPFKHKTRNLVKGVLYFTPSTTSVTNEGETWFFNKMFSPVDQLFLVSMLFIGIVAGIVTARYIVSIWHQNDLKDAKHHCHDRDVKHKSSQDFYHHTYEEIKDVTP